MLLIRQILGRVFALGVCAVTLAACGQSGALYLPTTPAVASRSTLPKSLPSEEINSGPAGKASAPVNR